MHLREDGAMEDVETREASTEATVGAEARDDGLWLGDAIDFFLSAKRAGGRSEKTVDDSTERSSSSSSAGSRSDSAVRTRSMLPTLV
jgi:hypothetical protein